MKMLRTTVRLDAGLLREAKMAAAARRTTLTRLIEEGLRSVLAKRSERPDTRFELPTFKGNGLQPGVDLDDTADLLDRLDGTDRRAPR